MIAGVEKAKLVYILNRDAAANLTISSPLEAHKNAAISLDWMLGLKTPCLRRWRWTTRSLTRTRRGRRLIMRRRCVITPLHIEFRA